MPNLEQRKPKQININEPIPEQEKEKATKGVRVKSAKMKELSIRKEVAVASFAQSIYKKDIEKLKRLKKGTGAKTYAELFEVLLNLVEE